MLGDVELIVFPWILVTVKAPASVIKTSPLGVTAVATLDELPTRILPSPRVVDEPPPEAMSIVEVPL